MKIEELSLERFYDEMIARLLSPEFLDKVSEFLADQNAGKELAEAIWYKYAFLSTYGPSSEIKEKVPDFRKEITSRIHEIVEFWEMLSLRKDKS